MSSDATFRPDPQQTAAFVQNLTRCQPTLYAYIISLLPDHADVDDVLQQANVVLWEKLGEFEPGTNFDAWACRVAYYEVLTARKRAARSKLRFDDDLLGTMAGELAERADGLDTRRRALRECLADVPDHQRVLLERRYTDNDPIGDIAASLGRPVKTIYQTLYRLRRTLLDCIRGRIEGGAA
ncbi:MAG: sigma-70 family RNA polymerase sigma factor [Phycisphaera sp.]|nr:sigma-70 family RNA polymerase sigma factor [Phycisphaera sp.]